MSEKMLRIKDVVEKTKLSRSTIYAMVASGDFPAMKKLGKGITYWRESDIDEWIRSLP